MELINRLEVMDLFETWYCSKCTRACKPTACRACWVDDAMDVIKEATEYFVGDVSQYEEMAEVWAMYRAGELRPVVHAHWVTDNYGYALLNEEGNTMYLAGVLCSHCHVTGQTNWNYCPNCWAIMDEKEG